jgi:hypothetical protein
VRRGAEQSEERTGKEGAERELSGAGPAIRNLEDVRGFPCYAVLINRYI